MCPICFQNLECMLLGVGIKSLVENLVCFLIILLILYCTIISQYVTLPEKIISNSILI